MSLDFMEWHLLCVNSLFLQRQREGSDHALQQWHNRKPYTITNRPPCVISAIWGPLSSHKDSRLYASARSVSCRINKFSSRPPTMWVAVCDHTAEFTGEVSTCIPPAFSYVTTVQETWEDIIVLYDTCLQQTVNFSRDSSPINNELAAMFGMYKFDSRVNFHVDNFSSNTGAYCIT